MSPTLPKRWDADGCRALWALTTQRPADHNGQWFHNFGSILLKTVQRSVTCAACGQRLARGTEVLYADEYRDHELWAPRRRHLHKEPCL